MLVGLLVCEIFQLEWGGGRLTDQRSMQQRNTNQMRCIANFPWKWVNRSVILPCSRSLQLRCFIHWTFLLVYSHWCVENVREWVSGLCLNDSLSQGNVVELVSLYGKWSTDWPTDSSAFFTFFCVNRSDI